MLASYITNMDGSLSSLASKHQFPTIHKKMQAALSFAPPAFPVRTPTKTSALPGRFVQRTQALKRAPIKASAPVADDPSTVDYSSNVTSVFPAEACETIGGEACDAEMYPEVKLKPEAGSAPAGTATEPIDREYLEYNSSKTVFLEEACDDLGGEFCEPDFQRGT